MLRRVGLAHRQHLEHFGVLTGCSEARALPRTTCSPLCLRWTAMAAVAQMSHPARDAKQDAQQRDLMDGPPQTVRDCKMHSTPPILPAGILAMTSALLSQSADESTTLNKIRTSQNLLEHLTDHEKARKLAEALACTQSPLSALRVLNLARALGCDLKQNAYECVCFHLANRKHWRIVLSVVSLGKRETGRTTSRLLNWRARALAETQEFLMLQRVLEEFKEHNIAPTRRTFHIILSGHIRNRNLPLAKQCLRAMAESGTPPDASTHAIVATHYRALGADPHVQLRSLEALSGVRSSVATAIVNSLMQLRLDAHDLPGTLQLLALFKQSHVGAIFDATVPAGGLDAGNEDVYPHGKVHFTHHNLIPNAPTFSIFINYLAAQSNLTGALRILESMIATGIRPTTGIVTSLIHAFFSVGRGDIAVRMVTSMCDSKRVPLSMFEPMLSSPDKVDIPWVPSGLSPTSQVFNALLRGVLSTRGLDVMDAVLRVMHASHVEPNAATLEILMAHLSKVEQSNPGVLLRVLRRFSSPDLPPTLRHMHIILSCVLRHEKYLLYGGGWNTTAAKFSRYRREPQRRPSAHLLSGVADSFDPAAGIELSRSLAHRRLGRSTLLSLSSRKVLSDPAMIALRIRRDALVKSDSDSAKEVFHALLDRGMHPNEYHFSALMEGLAQSGDLDGASNVMRSAERAGIRPNVVMFTILIVGYARQGNPDMAIQTFQQMVAADVKPDVPSIDAVSGAFFAVGAYIMARKVLTSLWPHVRPFPEELRTASLKDLARHFRSLHHKPCNGERPTKQERLTLQAKLSRLRRTWQLQSGFTRASQTFFRLTPGDDVPSSSI
ncbi:hypothetical protein Hypma_015419 [Hypsizygus marmoreus]|uniref:Pentatricopeptide repeat-containing protein n=1 Tax=Hypsizygus marmoreus TaxID=39966 RepID=A0A369KF85_HYPMA|nr:hypothetical protein Hypma_015419 [Hypsizygus marmoreus]